MEPAISINWLALGVSVIAATVFGFIWWGPLFGKPWAREMNLSPAFKPTSKEMLRSTLLQIVGAFLTAFSLAYYVAVWRPSVWNAGVDKPNYIYGFCTAFLVWLGFYVPQHLGKVAWENRSWKLFVINASGSLVSLMIVAMILAYWHQRSM
jgi:hypothetical protein